MEREQSPSPVPAKLTEAVARDYPAAEILVSFPNDWELVHSFKRGNQPLYVAGFPASQEQMRGDHFFGLPAEINRSLTTYRLYKLFEPHHTPLYQVAWNMQINRGQIIGESGSRVQLQPVGQAQMWKGEQYSVLWEGYFFETRRGGVNWLEELALFWQAVERDIDVDTIFTHPYEPTFQEGYTDFLRRLGYAPDPNLDRWWRKTLRA